MPNKHFSFLQRIGLWLAGETKSMPRALMGAGAWTGVNTADQYGRRMQPSPNDLAAGLKTVAWTCATMNAAICAAYPPKLFVTTSKNQPAAKCPTQPIGKALDARLRETPHLHYKTKSADTIQEVTDHPILDLLRQVNPIHNAFDLWELTTLNQEVHGQCFWYLDADKTLDTPTEIWILPTQNVRPKREPGSKQLVDYYEYKTGHVEQRFDPEDIIHFRYPDPKDPYMGAMSPLKAAWELVTLNSTYNAFRQAKYDNHAIPDAVMSPDEVIGEEERDRLETQLNQAMRRGGAGRIIVSEAGMKLSLLNHSMADMAALADQKATKEDICNAFHVPLAFFTTQTNLANLEASRSLHLELAINPRIKRRDEKLNEQLIPRYDPSGRLFLATDTPVPLDRDQQMRQEQQDLSTGVKTINDIRKDRGLPPVAWGDQSMIQREAQIKFQEMAVRVGIQSINEIRAEEGLPPVEWGDVPWLNRNMLQTDMLRSAGPGTTINQGDPNQAAPDQGT